jgi:hypothetical protein
MCFIQTDNCFPLAQLLLSSCQPASDQLEINRNEEGSFLFLEFFFLAIHIGAADGAIVGSVLFLSGHPLLGGIFSGGSWRYRSSRWCVQPKPFLHPFQSPCIMMNNCASKLQKSTYICIYIDLILELNLEVSATYLLFESCLKTGSRSSMLDAILLQIFSMSKHAISPVEKPPQLTNPMSVEKVYLNLSIQCLLFESIVLRVS